MRFLFASLLIAYPSVAAGDPCDIPPGRYYLGRYEDLRVLVSEDGNWFFDWGDCSWPSGVVITAKIQEVPSSPPTKPPFSFPTNSPELSAEAKAALRLVGDYFQRHPEITIFQVEGHADFLEAGSSEEALILSLRRAETVRAYLIEQGIVADRMVVLGHGDTRPLHDGINPDEIALNRRVDFVVVHRSIGPQP
jgi:flagellar motor protein MotB